MSSAAAPERDIEADRIDFQISPEIFRTPPLRKRQTIPRLALHVHLAHDAENCLRAHRTAGDKHAPDDSLPPASVHPIELLISRISAVSAMRTCSAIVSSPAASALNISPRSLPDMLEIDSIKLLSTKLDRPHKDQLTLGTDRHC